MNQPTINPAPIRKRYLILQSIVFPVIGSWLLIGLLFLVIESYLVGAMGYQFGTLHERNSVILSQLEDNGSVFGSEIEAVFSSYTSFGNGSSGTMILDENKALEISPMQNAIGGENGTRSISIYGAEIIAKDSKQGPGVLDYNGAYPYYGKVTSGNYGTKASKSDLNWCFVLSKRNVSVKFTNKSNGYPHSFGTPLTCVNGK